MIAVSNMMSQKFEIFIILINTWISVFLINPANQFFLSVKQNNNKKAKSLRQVTIHF